MYSLNDIENFLDKDFSDLNYGRYLLLKNFYLSIKEFQLPKDLRIAVVGGDNDQIEILILNKMGYITDVTTFGIENQDEFFDPNIINNTKPDNFFHLIICTQVIEHIWNHNSFFENIRLISKPETLFYIDCPKSNKVHMSPAYYSSGFTASYLVNNLKMMDFEILKSGEFGGEVLYKTIHLTQSWYNKKDILRRYRFNNRNIFHKIKHLSKLSNLGQYLVLKRNNNRDSEEYMTESYVFARKT